MRTFINFIHAPFIALGFIFQMIAGGFFAGRITATLWITGLAQKEAERRAIAEGAADVAGGAQKAANKTVRGRKVH